jgi:hypothetical protein
MLRDDSGNGGGRPSAPRNVLGERLDGQLKPEQLEIDGSGVRSQSSGRSATS